jgi:hypothetical protein
MNSKTKKPLKGKVNGIKTAKKKKEKIQNEGT